MSRPTIVVDLAQDPRFATDLAAGGVFVPACELVINDECDLVVRGASGELAVPARVVYIDPTKGAGLELLGFGPTIRDRIAALAVEPETTERIDLLDPDEADPTDDPAADGAPAKPANLLERLRGLSLAQQVKTANSPDPGTRMALERMYGKAVWEALIRNSRLTAPEVAKLARMGTMPRTLLENILANNAWLQIPEIRRALLANPRLGTDQITRVLRLMPKHELKVAATTTAYPFSVRDVAKRMINND